MKNNQIFELQKLLLIRLTASCERRKNVPMLHYALHFNFRNHRNFNTHKKVRNHCILLKNSSAWFCGTFNNSFYAKKNVQEKKGKTKTRIGISHG